MAAAQPRPYRRILTSALHRRFVHASALALLVCYIVAFSIGSKSSCKQFAWAVSNLCFQLLVKSDTCNCYSLLVMVPHQLLRCSHRAPICILSRRLRPSRRPNAPWLENYPILAQHIAIPFPSTSGADIRLVPFLRLVVH